MKRYVKISSEKQSNISSHRIRCCKIRKFFYLTFRYDYEVTFGLWKVFIYLDSNKCKRRKDTRRIWKSNATYLRIHRIRNSSTLWYIIIMTLHSIFAKYSFISMFIISTSDERVYEGYKSNAIYRIRRCKIRKFFYVTFHFDTITMLHSAFAKYTFFHLNNTNNYKRKNIYKKFGIYKFWYFRIEENFTLRNLDTISLYKIYIISLVIIINDEKKYILIERSEWKTPFEDSKCSIGGTEREFRPRTFQISRKRFERSRVTRSFHYVANKVSRRFHYIRAHFAYIFTGETPERCLPFTRNNDILRSSPTPAHRKRQFELQIHVRHFTIVTSSPNSPIYSSQ